MIGYACKHPAPPLRRVFVPLSDVVVLLWANDTGKSSLLRAVMRDLSGGHFAAADEEQARSVGGVFYAQLTPSELDDVICMTVDERQRLRSDHRPWPDSARPPWDPGMWELTGVRDLDLGGDPQATALAKLRERKTKTPSEQDQILDALAESNVVGFECAGRNQRQERVWNAYWCLPTFGSLPGPVRNALRGSDIYRFAEQRPLMQGERRYPRGHASFYQALHGRPRVSASRVLPWPLSRSGPPRMYRCRFRSRARPSFQPWRMP